MVNASKRTKIIMYLMACLLNIALLVFYAVNDFYLPCIPLSLAVLVMIYVISVEARGNVQNERTKKVVSMYIFAALLVLSMAIFALLRGATLTVTIMLFLTVPVLLYGCYDDYKKNKEKALHSEDSNVEKGEDDDADGSVD